MAAASNTNEVKFMIEKTNKTARTGTLSLNGKKPVQTPAFLVETMGGTLHVIPLDLLEELAIDLALIDLTNVEELTKLRNPSSLFSLPESIHTFACCTHMKQSELVSERGVMIETTAGRKEITPECLITSTSLLKPDFLIGLSDEPPSSCGSKRIKKAADRNLKWLKTCSELKLPKNIHKKEDQDKVSCSSLIGVITGGVNPYENKRCAEGIAKLATPGVVVGNIGCGESPEMRRSIVETALGQLPTDTFRIAINGFLTPPELMDAVSLGFDIISTTLPNMLTLNGQALCLPLTCESPSNDNTQQNINLRDSKYIKDASPLMSDCACHACKHHTRAYIHHLLIAHEMLGEVLLNVHNHHHLLEFFSAMRQHLHDGTFEQYRQIIDPH